jgi:hypothetical protein
MSGFSDRRATIHLGRFLKIAAAKLNDETTGDDGRNANIVAFTSLRRRRPL